jgi:hypothetical protein
MTKYEDLVIALEQGEKIEFEDTGIWDKEDRTIKLYLDINDANEVFIVNRPERVQLVKIKGIIVIDVIK